MESVKNVVKSATGKDSQFTSGMFSLDARCRPLNKHSGHQVPIQDMSQPSQQSDMKGPDPVSTEVPTEDGGYQTYKAAKKLEGKKAIITGGDSGIGRAIAILYAMEGADSIIAYLPDEQKDAEETRKTVEEHGGKCYLFPTDVSKMENCKKLVEEALEKMGAINIVVNNAAYQNMVNGIAQLSEYVPILSFSSSLKPSFEPQHLINRPQQRPMAQNLRHKHPPLLLPLQIRSQPHEIRRHNHKLRLRKCLHRTARSPRLHILQRRHHQLHPWPSQSTDLPRYQSQCRMPRASVDTADSFDNERVCTRSIQCNADGEAGTAE